MAASYLAAPRFTSEDEAAERASMTVEEKIAALSDLYGNLPIPQRETDALATESSTLHGPGDDTPGPVARREETEELTERSLAALDKALEEACEHDCNGGECDGGPGSNGDGGGRSLPYQRARRQCPDIVESREHRLLFLRAESFDVRRAVDRLLIYWSHRIDLFGDEHAFGPLTLESGAFDADKKELSMGYPRLSPEKDASSRAIIVINHNDMKRGTYDRRGIMRACWYIMHRALSEEIVQKNGIVFIGLGYGQLDQIDRKLDATLWRGMRDVVPCRLVSCHVVMASVSADLIMPNVKFMLGVKSRARLREYQGHDPRILEKLAEVGIGTEAVPSEIGGGWAYDDRWLEKR